MGGTKLLSSDFVPYEGQLLVLVKLFSLIPVPDPELLAAMRGWFWTISFNEGLRGKPDHYVTRAIRDATKAAEGNLESLDNRLSLRLEIFLDRRFIRGRALSAALASMLAVNGARSLILGELIDPENYMSEFSSDTFAHIYPLATVRRTVDQGAASAKVLANIIVRSEVDRKALKNLQPKSLIRSLYDRFGESEAEATLNSQFISREAAQMVLQNRPQDFLYARAKAMYDAAASLASRSRQPM